MERKKIKLSEMEVGEEYSIDDIEGLYSCGCLIHNFVKNKN